MKPDLFIADEPTGNLDEKNSKLITDLIITIHREGIPILFITHDMSLVSYILQNTHAIHISLL